MITLRIEHAVRDYDRWKAAFDSDPAGRVRSGVRRYAVCREVEDPLRVTIDLEFDDLSQARAMLSRLEQMWQMPTARAAVDGAIRATILQSAEVREVATKPASGEVKIA